MRKIPGPFNMPWASGMIVEEVPIKCPRWEPTIQLMEYEDGSVALRLCYYSHRRFGRGPMVLGEEDLNRMARAIGRSTRVRELMKRLLGPD